VRRTLDSSVYAGGVDNVTVLCMASVDSNVVDFGELEYNFTWRNRDQMEIKNNSRIILIFNKKKSTLTLSPLSTEDTKFTCSVTVSEKQGRLLPSEEESQSFSLNIKCKQTEYKCLSYVNIFITQKFSL